MPARLPLVLLLFAACAATTAASPEARPVPPGGTPLIEGNPLETARFGGGECGTMEAQDVFRGPVEKAARVAVTARPETPWHVALRWPTAAPLQKGDALLVTFWMRTRSSEASSRRGTVFAVLEKAGPPHTKSLHVRARTDRGQWEQFFFPATVGADYAPGEAQVGLFFGAQVQEIEIGGLQVLTYGTGVKAADLPRTPVTYDGRAPDATWRDKAWKRIRRNRMGRLRVTVRRRDGQGVPRTTVKVRLKRHAFGFGSAVTAHLLTGTDADARRYQQIVKDHFNKVVLENDLKWGPWEIGKTGEHPRFDTTQTMRALAWLARQGIECRGHWFGHGHAKRHLRYEALKDDPQAFRQAWFDHLQDELPQIARHVSEIDIINHLAGWPPHTHEVAGGPEIYVAFMKLGRALCPGVELYVNEGHVLAGGGRIEPYAKWITYLRDQEVGPDGIGFMGHFTETSLTPPGELYDVLDRFAPMAAHLQVTELDVDTTDESLQADYLRDVLLTCYSHPAVEGVVLWGFWEGRHWRPDAALYRKDWAEKPAARAWVDLVKRKFWTEEAGATDSAGNFDLHGYAGEYEVEILFAGRKIVREVALTPEDAELEITVR